VQETNEDCLSKANENYQDTAGTQTRLFFLQERSFTRGMSHIFDHQNVRASTGEAVALHELGPECKTRKPRQTPRRRIQYSSCNHEDPEYWLEKCEKNYFRWQVFSPAGML